MRVGEQLRTRAVVSASRRVAGSRFHHHYSVVLLQCLLVVSSWLGAWRVRGGSVCDAGARRRITTECYLCAFGPNKWLRFVPLLVDPYVSRSPREQVCVKQPILASSIFNPRLTGGGGGYLEAPSRFSAIVAKLID